MDKQEEGTPKGLVTIIGSPLKFLRSRCGDYIAIHGHIIIILCAFLLVYRVTVIICTKHINTLVWGRGEVAGNE